MTTSSRRAKIRAVTAGAGSVVDLSGRATARTFRASAAARRARVRPSQGDGDWHKIAADFSQVIETERESS